MAKTINLIPKTEVRLQQKKKLLTISTITTLVFLVIILIVSIIVFFLSRDLNNKIAITNTELQNYRNDIQGESEIEIVSRNLEKKVIVISELLQTTPYYSNLIKELDTRKPNGIDFREISVRSGRLDTLEVSGIADNYLLVSEFLSNILNEQNFFNDSKYFNLFTSANLNNVSLESDGSPFSITITFDKEVLMEKL